MFPFLPVNLQLTHVKRSDTELTYNSFINIRKTALSWRNRINKIRGISRQIAEEYSRDIQRKYTCLMLVSTKEIQDMTIRADPYLWFKLK